MNVFEFNMDKPFILNLCGKFNSPDPEWMHMTRDLMDYELILVTEGCLYIADDLNEYIVNSGEYLLMNPTSNQHGYKASECVFYWVHFSINNGAENIKTYDLNEIIYKYNQGQIAVFKQNKLSEADRVISLIKQLIDSDRLYREYSLKNFLCSAVICEIFSQSSLYKNYAVPNRKEQLYIDIVNYVSLNINKNIKISDIALNFNYNEKYISAFFKTMSGITLKQHIIQEKIQQAKTELSFSNHKIKQIAYNLGFSDEHNFSAMFKKITGLTPIEYRKAGKSLK